MSTLRKLTEGQLQTAREQIAHGKTYRAVAKELGVQHSGLHRLITAKSRTPFRSLQPATIIIPDDVAVRSYLAAFIDGEGSISKVTNKELWTVCAYNTYKPVIEWFASFGGILQTRKPQVGIIKANQKQYVWKVNKQLDVHVVLTAILPYLIIKSNRASEALAKIEAKPAFVAISDP